MTRYFVLSKIGARHHWCVYPYVTNCLGFPLDRLWKSKSKNVSGEPLNCIFNAVAKLVFFSPSDHILRRSHVQILRHKHHFLGCWFFLSNLLTSPIHNIFTGYFFKICIGPVLKTTERLLIMDYGPRCSVRWCLLNSWQQCLGVKGLSFFP